MDSPLRQRIATLATRFANEVIAAISEELASAVETRGADGRVGRRGRRPGGVARSAAQIRSVADRILAALGRAPDGLRAENLRAELGLSRSDIVRPLAVLRKEKRLRLTGRLRATVYTLAEGRSAKDGKAPAAHAPSAKAKNAARPKTAKGGTKAKGTAEKKPRAQAAQKAGPRKQKASPAKNGEAKRVEKAAGPPGANGTASGT
jgi:hypothetical protein